jgi:hypothetical protein
MKGICELIVRKAASEHHSLIRGQTNRQTTNYYPNRTHAMIGKQRKARRIVRESSELAAGLEVMSGDSTGFVGVIGEYDDPFAIFPDFGLTNYGPGLTDADFLRIFSGPNGGMWSVQYGTQASGVKYTNVTVLDDRPTAVGSSNWGAIKNLLR